MKIGEGRKEERGGGREGRTEGGKEMNKNHP